MGDIIFKNEDINLKEHRRVSKNTGNVTYEMHLVDDEDTKMMVK